jgi:hypothetical protein
MEQASKVAEVKAKIDWQRETRDKEFLRFIRGIISGEK